MDITISELSPSLREMKKELDRCRAAMEEQLVSFEEANQFAQRYAEYYCNVGGGKVVVPPSADLYFSGWYFTFLFLCIFSF